MLVEYHKIKQYRCLSSTLIRINARAFSFALQKKWVEVQKEWYPRRYCQPASNAGMEADCLCYFSGFYSYSLFYLQHESTLMRNCKGEIKTEANDSVDVGASLQLCQFRSKKPASGRGWVDIMGV